MKLRNCKKLDDLPIHRVTKTSEDGQGEFQQLRPALADTVTYYSSEHARDMHVSQQTTRTLSQIYSKHYCDNLTGRYAQERLYFLAAAVWGGQRDGHICIGGGGKNSG